MIKDADLATLSPVQKMDLANLIYDILQQELETATNPFAAEQVQEIERSVAADRAAMLQSESRGVVDGTL